MGRERERAKDQILAPDSAKVCTGRSSMAVKLTGQAVNTQYWPAAEVNRCDCIVREMKEVSVASPFKRKKEKKKDKDVLHVSTTDGKL